MSIKHFITAFLFSFGMVYHIIPFEGVSIPVLYNEHVRIKKIYDNSVNMCKTIPNCIVLAEAGYYESRDQSDKGMMAVMKVILNRVKHRNWPDNIKDVIYYNCQFSYTCDGSIGKRKPNKSQWERSYRLAYLMIKGYEDIDLNGSTHYHTTEIKPYWAKGFKLVTVIQDHIFYRCTRFC